MEKVKKMLKALELEDDSEHLRNKSPEDVKKALQGLDDKFSIDTKGGSKKYAFLLLLIMGHGGKGSHTLLFVI